MLALALSGCNWIEVDPKMQADEDIAKLDKADAAAAASYAGGEVTIGEAMGDFNAAYNETSYMYYYYFGYQMTHDAVSYTHLPAGKKPLSRRLTACDPATMT